MKFIVQEMIKGNIKTFGTEFKEVQDLMAYITECLLHQIPINITYGN